jgi:pyruvate dehydrogenase E1 component alpha subunit
MEVDGNDVFAVDLASQELVSRVRSGQGPQFLHAITYRFKGHVSVDPATYRDGEEVSRALENDPLTLVERKLDEARAKAIRKEAEEEVRKALAAAAAAPWPQPGSAYTDIQDAGAGEWR